MALTDLRNALMTGKRTPTAKDYVQDGLVAMWDGIENVGWGIHDPNATVWKDLVGSNDLTLTSYGSFDTNAFKTFLRSGASGYWSALGVSSAPFSSIEMCAERSVGGFVMSSGSADNLMLVVNNTYIQILNPYIEGFTNNEQIPTIGTSSGVYDGNVKAYSNATPLARLTGTNSWASPSHNSTLAICGTGGMFVYQSYLWGGRIFNLRLYSRALTAEEIAHNYNIDKTRFNLP